MTTLLDKVRQLEDIFITCATGGKTSDEDYSKLRLELLKDRAVTDLLPSFVKDFDQLPKFWGFIKVTFSTYADRREFIWDQFRPLIVSLEEKDISESQPADDDISTLLINFDTEHIHIFWKRALERRNNDPEGAITMARTLIESVCKHILDEEGISYKYKDKDKDKDELPELYYKTAKQLNIAADQYQEEALKQIFGGCRSVILGLGALRNRLSDSHGKGKQAVKPSSQQAALAVNLAGSMAAFLVATWEEHSSKKT
jgi:hypothetical protein